MRKMKEEYFRKQIIVEVVDMLIIGWWIRKEEVIARINDGFLVVRCSCDQTDGRLERRG